MPLLLMRCSEKTLYVVPVSGQQRKEKPVPVEGVKVTLNLGVGWEPCSGGGTVLIARAYTFPSFSGSESELLAFEAESSAETCLLLLASAAGLKERERLLLWLEERSALNLSRL